MDSSGLDLSLKLSSSTHGQGPPVLLIHGLGSSSLTWDLILPHLPRDHEFICLDLKGHGASPKPRDCSYSLSDQAELVFQFIKARNFKELTIVGHSYGGGVALATAELLRIANVSCLKRLVLIGSMAYPQTMPFYLAAIRTPFIGDLIAHIHPPRFIVRWMLQWARGGQEAAAPERVEAYYNLFRSIDIRRAILASARQMVPKDVDAFIAGFSRVSVPTLIIWGARDTIVPLHVGQKLEQAIPNSRLHVFDNCGHAPHEESPSAVANLLQDFFAQSIPRSL